MGISPSLLLLGTLGGAAVGLSLFAAAHAIIYKRDPRGSGLWVLICLFMPFLGPWLYWVLGINRVQRRAVRLFWKRGRLGSPTSAESRENAARDESNLLGSLGALRDTADRVTRLPLVSGNALTPLHNGEEAYPAMLGAIRFAQRSVTLASYIFDWDDVGREFCEVLTAAARRGVRVHVLLDGIGALGSWSRVGRRLISAGAKVAPFFPLRFPLGRLRINLRNHRKILVVDGRRGFTGGMNISHRHWMNTSNPNRCEDLHFQLEGPVVAQLQHVFAEDWMLAADDHLEGDAYFPPLSNQGTALCRGIAGGPDEDSENVEWILMAAFAAAQRTIRLATPYFIPTITLIRSMILAVLRGVQVTLILPSHVDLPFMRWAADAYLWQILLRGVRVFRRPTPFVHTKLCVVDERWTLLGSANLDPRSFRLNFEFNVEAYDPSLAARLAKWMDSQTVESEAVTLEAVDARPIPQRLRDGFVKLFSPHL